MKTNNTRLCREMALGQADRLLSLEDRSFDSQTFGSFDRSYWAWKFKDMQDACMQNGVYAIALLWSNDFEGNRYFKNNNVLDWVVAGITRWFAIQHRDGSFDQIFPHEHSYGATAFTLFYMLETYKIIESSVSEDFRTRFISFSKKAAEFLYFSEETYGMISNHRCAAAAALLNYFEITKEERYKAKAKNILSFIFNDKDEGWLTEYSGADPGYQTLGLYYLAKYYISSKDEVIFNRLSKIVNFLSYFMHPDGSFGGIYGSRNTAVFYPAGFALLEDRVPLAEKIINFFYNNLSSEGAVHLASMDEGNLVPLLVSYLETLVSKRNITEMNSVQEQSADLPFERKPFKKYFQQAGLYIVNEHSYYAIVGINKNGLLKIYDKYKKQCKYDDRGYLALTDSGKALSSNFFNKNVKIEIGNSSLVIKGFLSKISLPVPTPGKIFVLRALNLTLCRIRFVRELIKRAMVNILVMPGNDRVISLERKIRFSENGITVDDLFLKPPGLKVIKLTRDEMHSTIHMATSNYFRKSELNFSRAPSNIDIEEFNVKSTIKTSFYI